MGLLGKNRSKYGEFMDEHLGYGAQEQVVDATKASRDTVSKAFNDQNYRPSRSIMQLLINAARQLTGKNVDRNDFWM